MTSDTLTTRPVLFWGMPGDFSALALEALLQARVAVCGVIMPAAIVKPDMAPIQHLKPAAAVSPLQFSQPYLQRTTAHVAWEAGLPVWEVRRPAAPETAELVASFEPHAALVACFPWRIADPLLGIPACGFLNLHPSLLPELRGPYPLFWSFRLGRQKTGVTVHRMDSGFDTGPLALQRAIYLPDGISGSATDHLLGRQGGALLALAAQKLSAGTLSLRPQPRGERALPRPDRDDFTIPTSWSARRAFNFMRGTAQWNHPYRIKGDGVDLYVRQAVAFAPAATQGTAVRQEGRDAWIRFAAGVLHAR